MKITQRHFIILLTLLLCTACSISETGEDSELPIGTGEKLEATKDPTKAPDKSEQFVFTISDTPIIDYASNPMILDYEDSVITLAYESKATELMNAPSEKGKVAYSSDSYNFETREEAIKSEELSSVDSVQLDDGTYVKYTFNEEDKKIYAKISQDGNAYEDVKDAVYDLDNDIDEGYFGVRTFFVDEDGGVVLLYSSKNFGNNAYGEIFLREAYSEPSSNGLDFSLVDKDLAADTNQEGDTLSYFDPYIIELPDGRFLLITIYQEHFVNGGVPPKDPDGHIVGFISDGSKEFDMIGTLFSYSDFTFADVLSLNDPKGLVLEDGTIVIYVAAMVEDTKDENREYKWVLVNARTEPMFD